jgi:hypothetical protein
MRTAWRARWSEVQAQGRDPLATGGFVHTSHAVAVGVALTATVSRLICEERVVSKQDWERGGDRRGRDTASSLHRERAH